MNYFDFQPYKNQFIFLKKIWSGDIVEIREGFIEKYFLSFIILFPLLSPYTFFRSIKIKKKSHFLEAYPLIFLLAFMVLHIFQHTTYLINFFTVLFAGVRILDIFTYLSGIVFLAPYGLYSKPKSENKILIMLFINFIEIILCFSIIYFSSNMIGTKIINSSGLIVKYEYI